MKTLFTITMMIGLLSFSINDQNLSKYDDDGNSTSIKSFDWLIGQWQGACFGGIGEEIWTSPVDGVMMGMYRFYKDGKPGFYEFCHLGDFGDGIELRIKHFNPDFKGWESKEDFVSMKLIKISKNKAIFDGLTMELASDGTLQIKLDIDQGDGQIKTENMNFVKIGTLTNHDG